MTTCAADSCDSPETYGIYCSETCQNRDLAQYADAPEPVEMFGYRRIESGDGTVRFEPET